MFQSNIVFKQLQHRAVQCIFSSVYRNISKTLSKFGYEGDGKTTATILNNDEGVGLMIDGYSQVGFRLNNNVTVLGSMVIFPRSVLSWTINDISDITEEAFSLFTVLEPKIDIIVLGVGDKPDKTSYSNILQIMRKYKLPIEILPTYQACATFNFLNSEGRYVVGAMIPPKNVETTDDDLLKTKLRYEKLFHRNYK